MTKINKFLYDRHLFFKEEVELLALKPVAKRENKQIVIISGFENFVRPILIIG